MESAIRQSSNKYEFDVSWEPFLLRPNMPKDGIQKQPPAPGNARVSPHLKAAGEGVGIDFTGKCDRYPNTIACHALLEYAGSVSHQVQNDLQEAIFQAYFTDGLYPDEATLIQLAEKNGKLDLEQCKQVLRDEQKLSQAREKALSWSAKGVTGVPMFYMNGQPTFSGAQDVDSFVKTFDIINTKFPLSS